MHNKKITGIPNDIYGGKYAIMAYQANKSDICGVVSWQIYYQDTNKAVLGGMAGKEEDETRLTVAFSVPYVHFKYVRYLMYLILNRIYQFYYYTKYLKYHSELSLSSGTELKSLPENGLLIQYT